MSKGEITYEFTAVLWQFEGPGGWYFISLPKPLAREIRNGFKSAEQGWGRLSVRACIGISEWETAIWFDTKKKTYLLPVKAEIRRKESLAADQRIKVTLRI